MTYTLRDVTNFCYKNRGRRGFPGAGYQEIAKQVVYASRDKRLVIAADYSICAVCIFTPFENAKKLYINHIVAIRLGFASLIAEANRRFPGWTIRGRRGDKIVTYKHLWVTTPTQAK
jgi:hypothetical protein